MLWVLKRTVSMKKFFWTSTAYVEIDGMSTINKYNEKKIG